MEWSAVPFEQETLKEKAQHLLRQAIVEGKAKAGETLVASRLSHELGISRTPIREALLALEQEGWVERLRSGVMRVREPSAKEIEELYAIRGVLEGLSCRYAATLIGEEDLGRLRAINDQTAEATEKEDFKEIESLGREFHALIHEVSGLRLVRDQLAQMRDHINRYRILTIATPGRTLNAFDEHLEILRALEQRSPEQAEDAMKRHIDAGWLVMQEAVSQGFVYETS